MAVLKKWIGNLPGGFSTRGETGENGVSTERL